MRVLVDLSKHVAALQGAFPDPGGTLGVSAISQVEKDFDIGIPTAFNGRYIVPVPEGLDITVDSNSHVLPVDGSDIASLAYAELLARFPMYEYIYTNPMLTQQNVGELDLTKDFVDNAFSPAELYPARVQTGKDGDPTPDHNGQAPCSTALLPINSTTTPPRPGMVITDAIDLLPYTGGVGADDFMVYWKIYEVTTSHDIGDPEFGALAGENIPAIRSIEETPQEASDFHVYLSIDDGANWHEVGRLEAIGFCCKADEIRLAFRNDSAEKVYLASFAVMF